ncbi:uncharacterized protein LY79DRAFT_346562 [Colletotrichum navitas]|uniref:Uncharacterized protein n=1 Tax=Colletotrichum navitas TaxID=681940 RepID=A0AAD8PSQ7_9PEZI|nr:uncharacterized protein LY79DRAFT_346562 [Colletotrichum navitas]KAK1579328.1 hypothetical protein LY79DRAFT_346562 [Colletotrichum navitas]
MKRKKEHCCQFHGRECRGPDDTRRLVNGRKSGLDGWLDGWNWTAPSSAPSASASPTHTTPIGSNPQSKPHPSIARSLSLSHSLSLSQEISSSLHPPSTHDFFPFSLSLPSPSNPFSLLFPLPSHQHRVSHLLNASSSPSQRPHQLTAGLTVPKSHLPLQLEIDNSRPHSVGRPTRYHQRRE